MKYGNMQFIAAVPPSVDEGDYRVSVGLKVTEPVTDNLQGDTLRFNVGESQRTFDSGMVYDCYPPAGMTADYSTTLPHIVLKQAGYPWSHRIDGKTVRVAECNADSTPMPWVALLLFDGDDLPEIKQDNHAEVIDLPRAVYDRVMPPREDLPWLTHARMVDLHEKEDNIIGLSGAFSVVVCGRFPPKAADATQCAAHLVSLDSTEAGGVVRLVSLYHWSFATKTLGDENFRQLAETLDCDNFHIKLPASDGAHDKATDRIKRGYTICNHILRTGEHTASWYRGPLIPVADKQQATQAYGADGRIEYDKETGVFDMSYAAAWQLGRLMMLRDKAVAGELWQCRKHAVYRAHCRTQATLANRHVASEQDDSSPKRRIMRMLAGEVGERLVGSDIISAGSEQYTPCAMGKRIKTGEGNRNDSIVDGFTPMQ